MYININDEYFHRLSMAMNINDHIKSLNEPVKRLLNMYFYLLRSTRTKTLAFLHADIIYLI